jgi:hypothetical protein
VDPTTRFATGPRRVDSRRIAVWGQSASVTAHFVHQPYDDDGADLHDFLTGVAAEEAFTDVRIAVAWVKRSGIQRVRACVDAVQTRGGRVDLTFGIDEGGGTAQGLRLALEIADTAQVFHDPSGRTFHPKVYLASGAERARLLVGSHNLTAGGTYFNYEAGVVLELDRAEAADEEVVADVLEYFERLKSDAAVCKTLDEALLAALLADPRYQIGDEDQGRSREGLTRESPDGGDSVVAPGPSPLFGASSNRMRRDPAPSARAASTRGVRSSTTVAPASGGGATPPPVATASQLSRVIRRWNKEMSRSDCGQPNPHSHTTGALRFTQAGQPIDQADWPRHRLFGHLPWQLDPRYPGREMVTAQFNVTIHGTSYGLYQLVLKHDARRESHQNNFTTDLKWAQLPLNVRQLMDVHDWISVERHADGSVHLTVTAAQPTGGFYDDLAV